jgi:hypothetical protein
VARAVVWGGAAAIVLGAVAAGVIASGPPSPKPAPAPARALAVAVTSTRGAPVPATIVGRERARALTQAYAQKLASPEGSLSYAVEELRAGRDDLFRRMFVPELLPALTPDVLSKCRARLVQGAPAVDWAAAVESTEGGRRVRRVRIFGEAATGFVEVDGQWFADRLWCAD